MEDLGVDYKLSLLRIMKVISIHWGKKKKKEIKVFNPSRDFFWREGYTKDNHQIKIKLCS